MARAVENPVSGAGAGDLHEVKILPHATVISGSETPAIAPLDLTA